MHEIRIRALTALLVGLVVGCSVKEPSYPPPLTGIKCNCLNFELVTCLKKSLSTKEPSKHTRDRIVDLQEAGNVSNTYLMQCISDFFFFFRFCPSQLKCTSPFFNGENLPSVIYMVWSLALMVEPHFFQRAVTVDVWKGS